MGVQVWIVRDMPSSPKNHACVPDVNMLARITLWTPDGNGFHIANMLHKCIQDGTFQRSVEQRANPPHGHWLLEFVRHPMSFVAWGTKARHEWTIASNHLKDMLHLNA